MEPFNLLNVEGYGFLYANSQAPKKKFFSRSAETKNRGRESHTPLFIITAKEIFLNMAAKNIWLFTNNNIRRDWDQAIEQAMTSHEIKSHVTVICLQKKEKSIDWIMESGSNGKEYSARLNIQKIKVSCFHNRL